VTITQDLRTRAKHRGKTPWQLVQTVGRLEREADNQICRMVAMATEIDELKAERTRLEGQLDAAGIDYSGALEDARQASQERDEWRARALALQARFGAQIAAEENANAITVPPAVRPIDGPEDEATAPIDVRPLWKARDAGLLGPVLDPGQAVTGAVTR
jgi:outer membrane murein-binding lipoprotein Lpp